MAGLCATFSVCLFFCLSLLTVAIIKSCPVRYVAHGCYWCPFITHYRWVPVLVLTGHKPADTHTRIHIHTLLHTHILWFKWANAGWALAHRHTNTHKTYSKGQQNDHMIRTQRFWRICMLIICHLTSEPLMPVDVCSTSNVPSCSMTLLWLCGLGWRGERNFMDEGKAGCVILHQLI